MGILSFKLCFSHLHEQVIVNVVVTVDSVMLRVLLKDLVAVAGTVHLHLCHLRSKRLLSVSCRGATNTVVGLRKFRLPFSQFRVVDQAQRLTLTTDSEIHRIFCLLHHLLRVSFALSILIH